MNEQIHWSEGLFLQPHHLQAMQRQQGVRLAAERRLEMQYPYGVIEARLSPDALENHSVRFSRLRVVMPSGLTLDFPDDTDLPPLDIKAAFEADSRPLTVFLGVPLWYPGRGNTIEFGSTDDWRTKRIFRVAETTSVDENTGENPQPVRIRRLNARLMLDSEDQTDLEVLPLLRIVHGAGEGLGLPRQDPAFIPPCLLLGGSVTLRDMVRDVANAVEASRKELAQQLQRSGFNTETLRGGQFEQMLRLRTLNRFSARLPQFAVAPATTPFAAYLELRELLAELAALHPERDDFDVADYDHMNPAVAFQELDQKIRPHLKRAGPEEIWKVKFVPGEPGTLVANLTEEQLTRPNEYFLGIKTRQDPSAVAALVQDIDQFKLMARSKVRLRVWGVKLQEERQPPLQLPSEIGLTHFRLLRDGSRMWEDVVRERAIAARWTGLESSDFQLTLYMTLPK
ncbi:MAG TPA: type VI secretion system baseplate subunit TssK [Tepidisphaeraceae bacterium]|jgi:type VI secretion system ImpJ/VasE family protein